MEDTASLGSVQISFRNVTPPESAEPVIRERINELTTFAPDIISCGSWWRSPIGTIGGATYITCGSPCGFREMKSWSRVSRLSTGVERHLGASTHHKATELASVDRDLYTGIHQAFDLARRQLQDWVRRSRGKVKTHEAPPHGRVIRLLTADGCGFIATDDDREIYFHRNAVRDDKFEQLDIGSRVSFAEEAGDRGPQESTVRLLGKHHYR